LNDIKNCAPVLKKKRRPHNKWSASAYNHMMQCEKFT